MQNRYGGSLDGIFVCLVLFIEEFMADLFEALIPNP